jgi:AcrR family transcriptional regulator
MNRGTRKKAIRHGKTGIRAGAGGPKTPGNRERILAAALRLFTSQGFHGTPTAQISREAGVSTGTLFHYFPDKNTLIDELYLLIQREVAEAVRACDDPTLPTRRRLERCFRGYIAWGMAHPEEVRFFDQFYNSPNIGDDVKHEVHKEFWWVDELCAAAIREGVLRDVPLDFYFVMVPRILNGILELMESGRTALTPDEIIENGLRLILKE